METWPENKITIIDFLLVRWLTSTLNLLIYICISYDWIISTSIWPSIRLHRCWSRMLKTFYVSDKFDVAYQHFTLKGQQLNNSPTIILFCDGCGRWMIIVEPFAFENSVKITWKIGNGFKSPKRRQKYQRQRSQKLSEPSRAVPHLPLGLICRNPIPFDPTLSGTSKKSPRIVSGQKARWNWPFIVRIQISEVSFSSENAVFW